MSDETTAIIESQPAPPHPVSAGSPEDHLAMFRTAFAEGRLLDATDVFSHALTQFPDSAFRVFISEASAQLAQAISGTDRTEEFVGRLDGMLSEHPNMNALPASPSDLDRVVHLREEHIANGLPSPVLIAESKSASTTVARIFNWGFDLPSWAYSIATVGLIPGWLRDYARGGASYTTHLMPTPEAPAIFKAAGIDRLIVHVRDPRQAILSWIHHVGRHPDHLVADARRMIEAAGEAHDLGAKIVAGLGVYQDRIRWLEGWIAASAEIEILFSDFRDYVQDQAGFIDRYLEFYGAPTRYFDRERAIEGVRSEEVRFRAGLVDEWREVLPKDVQQELTRLLPEAVASRFGWQLD